MKAIEIAVESFTALAELIRDGEQVIEFDGEPVRYSLGILDMHLWNIRYLPKMYVFVTEEPQLLRGYVMDRDHKGCVLRPCLPQHLASVAASPSLDGTEESR